MTDYPSPPPAGADLIEHLTAAGWTVAPGMTHGYGAHPTLGYRGSFFYEVRAVRGEHRVEAEWVIGRRDYDERGKGLTVGRWAQQPTRACWVYRFPPDTAPDARQRDPALRVLDGRFWGDRRYRIASLAMLRTLTGLTEERLTEVLDAETSGP